MTTVYTVGHSTRPIEEFVELLAANQVRRLVDIRTVPGSRHNPQFGEAALAESLPAAGIEYCQLKDLGGLRPKTNSTLNAGWENDSFRAYADYMQTPEFARGIAELIDLADERVTAIMCAEAVPWRCHRRLVGDALLARGVEVVDIISLTRTEPHQLTEFAQVDGLTITYPP